ncbi:CaiB/BaiF CoA transferase family protein [Rhabdothermincola salaria]|uniref:CaiB/BaiF CoA transferase family protein n=1 Tax=Rhabdothermincola salaria TaxID=2903142 RepID=UPI001E3D51F2|nr:CoA transferase [Rhabdothermincola salaria]
MSGPLEGVKVVELGMWVAGPAAGGILADWGADVIKLEPPGIGDPARTYQALFGEMMPDNPVFEMDNRSKRSVVVDLRRPEGQALAMELLEDADVFVTNLRQSALERWALDPETVLERCPRLVYQLITGYGMDGPDAHRPAYDIGGFWARSGIASLLRTPDGPLPFQRGGMGDHPTGSSAAGAVCAALFNRERTGKGQLVSTSLVRQGIYSVGFDVSITLGWGAHIGIGRREEMGNPSMNNYVAGDDRAFWLIGQEGERHWPPLARVVGHPEWLTDERFATPMARRQNAAELVGLLDEIFATKTLDEWAEVFDTEPDMFWAPVNTIDDVLVDPQVHAAGAFVSVPDADGGSELRVASPSDFYGTPWEPRGPAPRLGEHTLEVLEELGRSEDDVAALTAAGIVGPEVLTAERVEGDA